MIELDEYTSLRLAEWEQKRNYFDDCTGITDYEKFMLCFYLLNFIYFIELNKCEFESFFHK